jgi:tetratricopeptide (TPR) repeat protein
VFWIDASSLESITMSLKGIFSLFAAQASGVDGPVESALQWISCIQEEWLIIFDNADEPPEVVAKFIPPGSRGNILITSRNPAMGRIIAFENSIQINEMEELEAMSLLLKASCLDDAAPEHLQAARTIVTELGCIPLAVDHAGAYIQAGNCDINEYLRQFSLHRQTLMSDDAVFKGESNYNQTVYGTWDLSFKEIGRRAGGQSTINAQAAHAAILILQLCAFYHHSNISKAIFRSAAEQSRKHAASGKVDDKLPQAFPLLDHTLLALDSDGHWDDFIFGKGIAVLLSFSLIKRGQSSEMLSLHPLVHCWSREHMSESDQQRIYQMASIILSCAIPRRDKIYDYTLRRLIFPHIKANELYSSQMRLVKQYYDDKYTNFGSVMREHGDWNNAEQLEVQVLDMRKKLLGAEHPNTLRSMANLALIYRNQGRQTEAEQLEVQVMDIRTKLLGAEHRETLRSMAKLAITYSDQGRLNEAEHLGVQVMDMKKRLFGAEDLTRLRSMGHLANIYRKQGRWNEAEQLEVEVVEMSTKLLGEEHPHTLSSMGNLAITYHKQGKLNKAEKLSVKVMELSKKLLGAEHPSTLNSMGNLANTYRSQGRWNKAEQLQGQVMEIKTRLLGAEHPSTLRSMGNLANTYSNQKRWDEAKQLQIQVMEISKKLLGAEHPDTLIHAKNLEKIHHNQRRWNEAGKLKL